jgi:glycosyltransferase involved in cell wall biosynthesis
MSSLPPALPRISIAVPSFNQAAFIRETLQSLVDQQYPNLEVLVQDAGSTDGAIDIAREFVEQYPEMFSLVVQKDRGHAHALNMAYARATGTILGYLNTDDTLYPGCLHRVAHEIDPARGRFIVFGRSLFTGEGSRYVGLEHPAEYHGHFDLLAIWTRGRNTIPQPSTFWHRRVFETCGDFDETRNHGLDYLQWCNFSSRFRFHKVDELWSTYRMHAVSVSANKTEQEWLDIMIGYSRLHWGPRWRPLYWRCALSLARHRAHLGYRLSRFPIGRGLMRMVERASGTPSTPAFAGRHPDEWIGPTYRRDLHVPIDATRLVLRFEHHGGRHHPRASPALWIDQALVERRRATAEGPLAFVVDLVPYRGRSCTVEVHTPEFFVPRLAGLGPDERRLSLLLREERVE